MSSIFSIGAMNQLADSLQRAGFSQKDLTALQQFNLKKIKDVLHSRAEIAYSGIIDTDQKPAPPMSYLSLASHVGYGQWKFSSETVKLFLSKSQKTGLDLGFKILESIHDSKDKQALNATVLYYLLDHPELIPRAWKKRGNIVFMATTFVTDTTGYFPYMCWDGKKWHLCTVDQHHLFDKKWCAAVATVQKSSQLK